jgi:hypothetical protein
VACERVCALSERELLASLYCSSLSHNTWRGTSGLWHASQCVSGGGEEGGVCVCACAPEESGKDVQVNITGLDGMKSNQNRGGESEELGEVSDRYRLGLGKQKTVSESVHWRVEHWRVEHWRVEHWRVEHWRVEHWRVEDWRMEHWRVEHWRVDGATVKDGRPRRPGRANWSAVWNDKRTRQSGTQRDESVVVDRKLGCALLDHQAVGFRALVLEVL